MIALHSSGRHCCLQCLVLTFEPVLSHDLFSLGEGVCNGVAGNSQFVLPLIEVNSTSCVSFLENGAVVNSDWLPVGVLGHSCVHVCMSCCIVLTEQSRLTYAMRWKVILMRRSRCHLMGMMVQAV